MRRETRFLWGVWGSVILLLTFVTYPQSQWFLIALSYHNWFIIISRFLDECPMIVLRIIKNLNMCFWISWIYLKHKSVQFSHSVMSDCDPMDCSTPGFPVHHQLPELTQTHVHRISDAIQPSHPLSSPSPPSFNLSRHQGLFQWVSSLHQVAKVLEFQLQHQSFQWTPRTDLL